MTQRRIQDKQAKRSSKHYSVFMGSGYGSSKCRQHDELAYVCDLKFTHKKPWLRDGMRKNQETGYPADITSLFNVRIGGMNLVGQVANGVLTTYLMDDVLDGIRQYYTVREVRAGFTLTELTAKTVNELIGGA